MKRRLFQQFVTGRPWNKSNLEFRKTTIFHRPNCSLDLRHVMNHVGEWRLFYCHNKLGVVTFHLLVQLSVTNCHRLMTITIKFVILSK
jgi:hypothetical protein